MTKPYHITQEQALEIAKQTLNQRTLSFALKSELQSYVNAALDKVLGEPVGEIVFHGPPMRCQTTTIPAIKTVSMFENWDKQPIGTKLYAPKELK